MGRYSGIRPRSHYLGGVLGGLVHVLSPLPSLEAARQVALSVAIAAGCLTSPIAGLTTLGTKLGGVGVNSTCEGGCRIPRGEARCNPATRDVLAFPGKAARPETALMQRSTRPLFIIVPLYGDIYYFVAVVTALMSGSAFLLRTARRTRMSSGRTDLP